MFIKDISRIPCLYNHQITKWRPGVAMLHHRNLSPSLLTDANVRTSLWSFRFLQQEDTLASDFYFKSTKESLFLQKAEYSCKHPHLVLKHCANTTICLLVFLGTWWEYLMWGGCRDFRKNQTSYPWCLISEPFWFHRSSTRTSLKHIGVESVRLVRHDCQVAHDTILLTKAPPEKGVWPWSRASVPRTLPKTTRNTAFLGST